MLGKLVTYIITQTPPSRQQAGTPETVFGSILLSRHDYFTESFCCAQGILVIFFMEISGKSTQGRNESKAIARPADNALTPMAPRPACGLRYNNARRAPINIRGAHAL
jgi:hypothetical protein